MALRRPDPLHRSGILYSTAADTTLTAIETASNIMAEFP
jgi:hypothetical protein